MLATLALWLSQWAAIFQKRRRAARGGKGLGNATTSGVELEGLAPAFRANAFDAPDPDTLKDLTAARSGVHRIAQNYREIVRCAVVYPVQPVSPNSKLPLAMTSTACARDYQTLKEHRERKFSYTPNH